MAATTQNNTSPNQVQLSAHNGQKRHTSTRGEGEIGEIQMKVWQIGQTGKDVPSIGQWNSIELNRCALWVIAIAERDTFNVQRQARATGRPSLWRAWMNETNTSPVSPSGKYEGSISSDNSSTGDSPSSSFRERDSSLTRPPCTRRVFTLQNDPRSLRHCVRSTSFETLHRREYWAGDIENLCLDGYLLVEVAADNNHLEGMPRRHVRGILYAPMTTLLS
ncbi:hypothetical protein BC826DRAFT_971952 [Russula brevipes]|nr:hypothetical protein BC826DRAFT_971952 [Russula brevipes]